MAKKQENLGELELEVMKILWNRGRSSVLQVSETLSKQRGCARTTILTIIQRLHKKGFLKRKKEDGVYRYEPTQKRQQVVGRLLNQFIDRVFDGSSTSLVQQLTGANMSEEEMDQIKAIIDKAHQAEE
ncbi:MAG: BlaI/MecI/CopY family transcriptional regulator [Planctomycetes bacterium]|nr:BlaI/MecI/CopY family transcriptional regulator [Planctomycetota bacterium]